MWHKGTQIMFTLVDVPSSEDEDDYIVTGTIGKPMHE
jgi:hypothetical protein